MSGNPWQGPHIWQLALSDALAEQSVLEESQTKGLEQNCFPHSRPFPITQTRCPSSRSQQPTLSGFFLGGIRGVPPGPLPWWWVARKSFPLISLHLCVDKILFAGWPYFCTVAIGYNRLYFVWYRGAIESSIYSCPYLLSSETTAKGTGLAKSAGKEDPVELDSSLTL